MRKIAAIRGASLTAVKGRLHRAREQLRERLLPVYAGTEHKSTTAERNEIMPQVKVATVLENAESKQHVIVLLDEAGRRGLNNWVGASDAMLIATGNTEIAPTRPMGIHLMISLLRAA